MAHDISHGELLAALGQCPKLGRYRHYKGGRYEVVGAVIEEATLEPAVLYRQLETGLVFSRPLKSWNEIVEYNGQLVSRFAPAES